MRVAVPPSLAVGVRREQSLPLLALVAMFAACGDGSPNRDPIDLRLPGQDAGALAPVATADAGLPAVDTGTAVDTSIADAGDEACADPVDDPIDWPALFQQAVDRGATVHEVKANDRAAFVAALGKVNPGDVILLAEGVYEGWKRTKWSRSGKPERPIIVTTRPKVEGSAGEVVIRDMSEFALFDSASHYIVGGMRFEEIGIAVFRLSGTEGEAVPGSTDNRLTDNVYQGCGRTRGAKESLIEIHQRAHRTRIDHSTFVGNYNHVHVNDKVRGDDRDFGPTLDVRVDHNSFLRPATEGFIPEMVAVDAYETAALQARGSTLEGDANPLRVTFEYNLVRDHDTEKVHMDNEVLEIKTGGMVVRYNVFLNNTQGGISLRGGHGNQVYGNVIVDGNFGIRVHGSRHRITNNLIVNVERGIWMTRWGRRRPPNCATLAITEDNVIAHNTVLESSRYGMQIGDCETGACRPIANCLIANNIVASSKGTLLHVNTKNEPGRDTVCDEATYGGKHDRDGDAEGGINTNITVRRNLFHATGTAKTGSGLELDDDPLQGDPLLERDAEWKAIGRLGQGSPAIDRAAALDPAVTADIDGFPRSCGDGLDVGADERCTCR